MGYNFPNSPTIGQVANGYVWDGEKWLSGFGGGLTVTDADLRYVNVAGDTMTGDLQTTNLGVKPASGTGSIQVQDNPATSTSYMQTSTTGLKISNNAQPVRLEANTNAGTNTNQLVLNTDGNVSMAKQLFVNSHIVSIGGSFWAQNTATTGYVQFGNSGAKYLQYDGVQYNLIGGALTIASAASPARLLTYGTSGVANTAAGGWPIDVTGVDRGILYLATGGSSIGCYFTQGSTANCVGQITYTTNTTYYQTSSDGRKKPLREPFNGLDIVNRLNPVYHNWTNEPDQWDYGVIAQEAYEVLPQMIFKGDDDADKRSGDEGFVAWGADYAKAVPVLIRAVQELSARLAALEAKNGV